MHQRIGNLLATAALALASATAPAAMTNVENAYETSARQVSLPAVERGALVVSACSGCKPVTLQADAQTLYFIGGANGEPVTLAGMREALRAPGADQRLLTVFYRLDNNAVTRVVLGAR